MVSGNRGFPDPDNPEDLSPNHEIIMAVDTDTDEEDNPYNDYEPLPTSDMPTANDTDDDDSVEEGAAAEILPPIVPIEDTLVRELWAGAAPKEIDIEMDSSKVNEVKQAMMNFTLPPSAIPEWANNIPEEQWKEQLMSRLQNRVEETDKKM